MLDVCRPARRTIYKCARAQSLKFRIRPTVLLKVGLVRPRHCHADSPEGLRRAGSRSLFPVALTRPAHAHREIACADWIARCGGGISIAATAPPLARLFPVARAVPDQTSWQRIMVRSSVVRDMWCAVRGVRHAKGGGRWATDTHALGGCGVSGLMTRGESSVSQTTESAGTKTLRTRWPGGVPCGSHFWVSCQCPVTAA